MPRESFYDEIEIEDFAWDPLANVYHYPCPCGDRFEISKAQLRDGDEVARCPSCSLLVRVIYEWDDFEDYDPADEEGEEVQREVPIKAGEPNKVEEAVTPAAVLAATASADNDVQGEKAGLPPGVAPDSPTAQKPLELPDMLDKLKVDPDREKTGTGTDGDGQRQGGVSGEDTIGTAGGSGDRPAAAGRAGSTTGAADRDPGLNDKRAVQ